MSRSRMLLTNNLIPCKVVMKKICEKIIQLSALKIKKVKTLAKHFQKNAHEIRKQLKDVYYWLKICPKDLLDLLI